MSVVEHFVFPVSAFDELFAFCFFDGGGDFFCEDFRVGGVSEVDVVGVNEVEVYVCIVEAGCYEPAFCVDYFCGAFFDVFLYFLVGCYGDDDFALECDCLRAGVVFIDSDDLCVFDYEVGGDGGA